MVLSLKKWKTRCILSAEWSNNDDSFLEDAIHAAKETYSEHCGQEELVDWLKSIRPCSQWRPSKEQMETLEYYMHTLICNKRKEILFGLYTDLKKLREE